MFLCLLHRFHRTLSHTLAAFDTKVAIYHRKAIGILRNGANRTQLNQWTYMVVRAYTFIDTYHDSVFVCKVKLRFIFHKIDFLYLYIEFIEHIKRL